MTMTEARPEVTTIVRIKVRCGNTRHDGRLCHHVIAEVDVDQWEEQRALDTSIECKRCGNVERLSRFM